MSRFKMTTEDPFYDDDGVLIDEDAEYIPDDDELAAISAVLENYDPFDTVNS